MVQLFFTTQKKNFSKHSSDNHFLTFVRFSWSQLFYTILFFLYTSLSLYVSLSFFWSLLGMCVMLSAFTIIRRRQFNEPKMRLLYGRHYQSENVEYNIIQEDETFTILTSFFQHTRTHMEVYTWRHTVNTRKHIWIHKWIQVGTQGTDKHIQENRWIHAQNKYAEENAQKRRTRRHTPHTLIHLHEMHIGICHVKFRRIVITY